MTRRWLQIKGDPSIRQFLFSQERQVSLLDNRFDAVAKRAVHMIKDRGVFHVKFHFSSSQITLWLLNDPFNYRVTMVDEFLDPVLLVKFPNHSYPAEAVLQQPEIRPVLERFKQLRFSDDTVYLRSGSLNIMNGSVGLNFSCDGSHYVDYREFLDGERYQPS